MFHEWVVSGVAFGVQAFFALAVFAGCMLAILCLVALLARIFGGN